MTIADQITRLTNAKAAIKQSIVNKGVSVSDTALLDEYPALIDKIEGGGEGGGPNPYQELYMQRTANETNMKGLFSYTPASTTLDLSAMNTSKVTDMSYMFAECKVPYLDLSGFDASNVSNMSYMFDHCTSEINIDGWDTSKLTNTSYMFSNFTNGGKYLDLSALDFSNVTSANYMFEYCNLDNIDIRNINLDLTKFNWSGSSAPRLISSATGTLDLSNWTLDDSITKLDRLCYWCSCTEINLTNWKPTNVTTMKEFFYYNTSLVRLIMPDWDMTNTTNTSSFIYKCDKLSYIDLSRSNDITIAKIASLVPAQKLATYGQILIPVDSSQANIEALAAKYWKPVGPRIDMTSTELVLELDEIKPGKSTKLYYGNPEPWYGDDANVEYVSSDETVATIDKETMTITSTGIEGTTEITARDIETQEIISVAPITLVVSVTDNYPNVIKFRGTSTPASNNYIKVNGTNVKLSAINYNSSSGIYTYDVGAPITSIQFNGYGSSYTNTCTDVVKINTNNMTSMEDMFYFCEFLTSIDVSSFDTSKVTNMKSMFAACYSLTSLDLSSFNTSQVTTMQNMFSNCKSLTSLNLSNFDTSKVTIMAGMFQICDKLHTLRLDNCSNDTINKIITSSNFPTNAIPDVTRKIYCKKVEAAGLTEPKNWVFEFVD